MKIDKSPCALMEMDGKSIKDLFVSVEAKFENIAIVAVDTDADEIIYGGDYIDQQEG